MIHGTRNLMLDANLRMKDAGLVAASAAATVDGSPVVKHLAPGGGYVRGRLVVDVSAIETASNDEVYTICVQGSNDETFATGVYNLATLSLGAFEVVGGSADSTTGRYVVGFDNQATTGDSDDPTLACEYVRIYTVVGGSVATGINYTAHIVEA